MEYLYSTELIKELTTFPRAKWDDGADATGMLKDELSKRWSNTNIGEAKEEMVQEKLKESEEKYRYFFNNAQVGLFWSRISDGKFLECNDTFAKLVGYDTREECLADYIALEHYVDLNTRNKMLEEIRNNDEIKDFEIQVTKRDGTPYWASISARVDLKENRIEGAAIDITARKNIEQKLKESEEKYRLIFENANDPISILDLEGNFHEVNDLYCTRLGYTREEILKLNIRDFVTPEYVELVSNRILDIKKKGFSIFESSHEAKDGRIIPVEINAKSILFENKPSIFSIARDITAHKIAEENLKKSQKKYKLLSEELELILDHIEGLVFYKDIKNRFIWVNNYIADAHKMKRDDLIGKNLFELYPEEVAQTYWDDDLEVINSRKPKLNIEEPWDTADGKKWVLTTKIPYFGEKGEIKGIIGTSLDITERKIAEIELQKSEATYREAYNRAEFYKDIFTHDINNILQNISNGIQLTEMYLNKPDKANALKRNISVVKSQVKRGSNLVSNVRKLSKISESETILFRVNCCEVLKKTINYIKNAFQDKNIKIIAQFTETNFEILANELLEDVFENILTNSVNYNVCEVISIQVKVNREMRKGINYIKMQFIDNGIGITDERKHQIFIRGYSEELSVHGMGLGLSLVKKIIYSYNGEIWMEDRVKGDYTKGNNCMILIPEVVNNG